MGYKVVIVGKDNKSRIDAILCTKEFGTIEEVLVQLEISIPSVYPFTSIRSIHIDKVR